MSSHHTNPIGDSLWRAGAGAGKTHNLVERVVAIAEEWARTHDGRHPRLVVTTFTRMATQELRVRLMEKALAFAAEGKKELIPFVTSRNQLFVTTLHGVMDSFLRSFGSEIGLEPGFRVGGFEEIESLVRRVGKRTLFPDSDRFSDAALGDAVETLLTEFDFKTTLRLLKRASNVRSEFGESARPASLIDMQRSIKDSFGDHVPEIQLLAREIDQCSSDTKWVEYSAWLKTLMREISALEVGDISVLETLLDAEPSIRNAGKIKIDFRAGSDWKSPIKTLSKTVESAKEEILSLEKFERINRALALVETQFSAALREEKLRAGLVELEDLELLALELIRKFPAVAEAYAETWDHWLIDEYQDTSPRQVELISALAKGRPQFVVGDPQQSIYLFRGARPSVFMDRERLAREQSHEQVALFDNRRSHPDVMNFINESVGRLGSDFTLMTSQRANEKNQGRKEGSKPSPLGAVTVLARSAAGVSGDESPENSSDTSAEGLRRAEAAEISLVVKRLLLDEISPASIAILSRSNKDLAIIAKEFARNALPFQIHTAGAYSDRLEISDLCALLSFLSNPHDDENLIHLARTVWFPIDEETLAKGYRRKGSLWSTLEEWKSRADQPEIEIEALQSGLLAARERGTVQAFREMLMACDFFSWCGVLDPSGRREANALKFMTKLAVAERQAGFVPRRFVDEILGGGDRGTEGESNDRDAVAAIKPDRIHLMTIHASKGLQFDHVFVPFAGSASNRGRMSSEFVFHEQKKIWTAGVAVGDGTTLSAGPLAREWKNIVRAWEQDEQKRLLYVALTRARESIFISLTGAPKVGSFMDFLGLNLTPSPEGTHGTYRTVSKIPPDVRSFDSSLVRVSTVPNSWGRIERSRRPGEHAGISVTRLLEMEDELSEVEMAAKGQAKPAPKTSRSLAMATAAARGTRLHRVFELAKPDLARGEKSELDTRLDSELMSREIARWFSGDDQTRALAALRWLLDLESPPLSQIIASGAVEWNFTYLRDQFAGTLAVEGQIDLWGRDSNGHLWVIDYKTGDSRYKEKALRQLKYYAEALIAGGIARSGEQISLCALYPFSEEVFTERQVIEWSRPRLTEPDLSSAESKPLDLI